MRGASRALLAIAAALTVLSVFAACGVPSEGSSRPINESDIPTGLQPLDPDDTTQTRREQRVSVWFVRESSLVSVSHRVTAPVTPTSLLADLLAGPSDAEQSLALRSAIPDPDLVGEVTLSGGVATVAIAAGFSDIPANDQVLAIGQIVLTLTGLPGVGRVSFAIDGNVVAVPLPSGNATDQSVSRDDFADLIGEMEADA